MHFLSMLPLAALAAAAPTLSALDTTVIAAAGLKFSTSPGSHWTSFQSCDVSNAQLPSSSSGTQLPAPSGPVQHILLGRGTQNYTCASADGSSVPKAVGAKASLYDMGCAATWAAPLMPYAQDFALEAPLDTDPAKNPPFFFGMPLIGHHYFTDATSPVFNLDTANGNQGYVPVSKAASVAAPQAAMKGTNNQGDGAVAWLYLSRNQKIELVQGQKTYNGVYRVNTAGGNPPATCDGMASEFQVQYAAQYWFY